MLPSSSTGDKPINNNRPPVKKLLCAGTAVVLLAACGQKSGVAELAIPNPVLGEISPSAAATDGPQDPTVSKPEGGSTASGSVGAAAGGAVSTGATTQNDGVVSVIDARPGEDVGAQVEELLAADRAPTGGSTVGITGDTINLGMHFPMTGSAPNPHAPAAEFNIYWDHLRSLNRPIGGRFVTMRGQDDKSTPSSAQEACRNLAEEGSRTFALLGFAGPGQIQACAHYALGEGIPYFAPGSSRYPLEAMSTHFSLSAPYPDQTNATGGILLEKMGGADQKNGWVRSSGGNTGDFENAKESFRSQGLEFESIYTVDALANPEQMRGVALDMRRRGIENIYFAATPFHFIYFWQAARVDSYRPQMTGPGFTITADGPLKAACGDDGAPNGSLFLSPYPAFSERSRWDPEYDKAVAELGPGSDNELNWWIWNLSRSFEKVLRLAGENLTRERLMWFAAHAPLLETGLMPPLRYSPDDHFTDESIHVLKARCDQGNSKWVGARAFLPL